MSHQAWHYVMQHSSDTTITGSYYLLTLSFSWISDAHFGSSSKLHLSRDYGRCGIGRPFACCRECPRTARARLAQCEDVFAQSASISHDDRKCARTFCVVVMCSRSARTSSHCTSTFYVLAHYVLTHYIFSCEPSLKWQFFMAMLFDWQPTLISDYYT